MKTVFSILICCAFLTQLKAQSNAVYPQGDCTYHFAGQAYHGSSHSDMVAFGIGHNIYLYATDTVINSNTYSTRYPSGFLRYDENTDRTYFYSLVSELEYDVTLASSYNIGDTLELTDVLKCYGNIIPEPSIDEEETFFLPYALGYFEMSTIYENPSYRYFGLVTYLSTHEAGMPVYGVEVYREYDDGDISDYYIFNTGEKSPFIPGIGFIHETQLGSTLGLLCISSEEDLNINYPMCVASIGETDVNNFVLFPNPTSGTFQLQTDLNNTLNLQILDNNGRNLKHILNYESGSIIDVSELKSGYYFMRIENDTIYKIVSFVIE